jgi:hypothetical protein
MSRPGSPPLFVAGCALLCACRFVPSGVDDPRAGDPDAADEPFEVPDAGMTQQQGMTPPDADVSIPPDAATPPEVEAPPPGWSGPPLIVGVGLGGRHLVSTDGVVWTGDTQDDPRDPTRDLTAVAYADGLVVAVGGGCAGARCAGRITTFDGARWAEAALPADSSWLGGVAHGNGRWVAAGAGGPTLVSDDGIHWNARGDLAGDVRALTFGTVGGADLFVAVGDDGLRARSSDGATWTDVGHGFPGASEPVSLRAVDIAGGTVVAGGEVGRRLRSGDGATWTDPAAGGDTIVSIVFADRAFLAFADNGIVHVSSDDGRSWLPQTLVNAPTAGITLGATRGARLYVGARGGAIATSATGLGWVIRLDRGPTFDALTAFAFAGQ